jgi:hypothetical protein
VCTWSVGLVQREIEAAGFTTVIISTIPDLTASVSVPRLIGVEHPQGRALGQPGDHERQAAVLRAALQAAEQMQTPGSRTDLPFDWPETPAQARSHPSSPPPIARYLQQHPLLLPKLLRRDIPEHSRRGATLLPDAN